MSDELRQYVCFQNGTEPAFSGELLNNKAEGVYHCTNCKTSLFSSSTKFDSGSGWPSFFDEIPDKVYKKMDFSHGMQRIEARCADCDIHLGHVFDDGPPPTYKRYCINSVALEFIASNE